MTKMQADAKAKAHRRGLRWRRADSTSVRTRVVAVLLLISSIGMIVAGSLTYWLQRQSVDQGIAVNIEQEIAELERLAMGVDPQTGQPFATADAVFRTFLSRNIPGQYEAMGGIVNGTLRFVSSEQDINLRDTPEIVAFGAKAAAGERVVFRDFNAPSGLLRATAIPVTVPGDPDSAVFMMVYEIGAERDARLGWVRTYTIVMVVTLLLAGGVGSVVATRLLRPLQDLKSATEIISSTDLSRRVQVTSQSTDEVATLARTFNSMLDRLQESFAAQRQFLDDAGHELRTPIAIVRGHLEVMNVADPADVGSTRELLLDELDRMHRLVDDLVLLSRARRPDFLRLTDIEVPRLVDDIFERVRYLGPQQWRLDPCVDGVVHADAQRLTQALVQLAANAAKYCPPEATVAVGADWTADREYLRLWVRDTGPGIEPDDQQRIFQRFARAATGRGVDGSGLGLSIVSAIAKAHGGRIELLSTPGRGATFTVVVPRIAQASAGDDAPEFDSSLEASTKTAVPTDQDEQ